MGTHVDLLMLTNINNMTRINHKISTHDYNVIFNDVVLMKWKKKPCSHFINFIAKKKTKDIVIMISILIHNYSNK